VVNPTFTALNSVVNGINGPNPFTGGEGPVTGTEVTITVTFDPPIFLPADHYFFRPEVGLSSGNFLWLSAPKPIVTDLQSWIRNDNLAPDWLRIGTDITHQGPFNASFSLSGEADAESIIDALVPCDGPASGGTWKNHGQYVSSVAHAAQSLANQGCISQQEIGQIVSEAAQSNCGTCTLLQQRLDRLERRQRRLQQRHRQNRRLNRRIHRLQHQLQVQDCV
jgi:hypothetical protein